MFENYLSSLSQPDKKAITDLIQQISSLFPYAVEGLSYGAPAFIYKSKALVGFNNAKNHLSLYPFDPNIIEVAKPDLDGYELGKGVIRFTADKPIPEKVIELIVQLRLESIDIKS